MDDFEEEIFISADSDGAHPEQAFCLCGSAWFEANVALNHDGMINAHGGPYICVECRAVMPSGWRGARHPDGSWFDPAHEDRYDG